MSYLNELAKTQAKLLKHFNSPAFNELAETQQKLLKYFNSPAFDELAKTQELLNNFNSPAFNKLAKTQQKLSNYFNFSAFDEFVKTSSLSQNFNLDYLQKLQFAIDPTIFTASTEYMEALLKAYNPLSQNQVTITNDMPSIVKSLNDILHSINFNSFLSSQPKENENLMDYITSDSPIIKTFDISDSFVIPIGRNRIRMKTSDFIALITLIFTIFAYFFPRPTNEPSPKLLTQDAASSIESQNTFKETIISLFREQNQFLLDIFESVDSSNSSQTDLLEEIKTSLQEQNQIYQEFSESIQTSPDSNETSFDYSLKSVEPSPLSHDIVQETDDPNQLKIDNTPKSLNTDSENE